MPHLWHGLLNAGCFLLWCLYIQNWQFTNSEVEVVGRWPESDDIIIFNSDPGWAPAWTRGSAWQHQPQLQGSTQISVAPFSFKSGVLNKRSRTFSSRMSQTILSRNKSDSKSPYSQSLTSSRRAVKYVEQVSVSRWLRELNLYLFTVIFLQGEQCLANLSSSFAISSLSSFAIVQLA